MSTPEPGRSTGDPDIFELGLLIRRNAAETHALAERVDYLTVAVGRGDPRFCKPQYAAPDFDCEAFDAWWAGRGRRVPSIEECLGVWDVN